MLPHALVHCIQAIEAANGGRGVCTYNLYRDVYDVTMLTQFNPVTLVDKLIKDRAPVVCCLDNCIVHEKWACSAATSKCGRACACGVCSAPAVAAA